MQTTFVLIFVKIYKVNYICIWYKIHFLRVTHQSVNIIVYLTEYMNWHTINRPTIHFHTIPSSCLKSVRQVWAARPDNSTRNRTPASSVFCPISHSFFICPLSVSHSCLLCLVPNSCFRFILPKFCFLWICNTHACCMFCTSHACCAMHCATLMLVVNFATLSYVLCHMSFVLCSMSYFIISMSYNKSPVSWILCPVP